MIEVRYCDISGLTQELFDGYLQMLPANLRDQVMRYRFFADRAARLIGRLLLRSALLETGYGPGLLALWENDANKKPFIKDWMPFNISHAKDLVVLAYCHEGLVGIDVESRDAKLDIGAFSGCFCPEEQQMINGATDPLEAFLNLWVKKEAVLKAHGNGIVSGLDQIDCRNDDVSYEHQLWRLARLCLNEKYICYLATDNKEITVNLECVSLFGFM